MRTKPDSFIARAGTTTAVAVYIFVVGLVYSLVLRALWEPTGLQRLVDIALHDVMPLLYIGFWLWFIPKGGLRWTQPFGWLAYPLLYGAYALGRGALTGWYPYPFVDASALGYARVGLNLLVMAIGFLVLGITAVGLGRLRESPQDPPLSQA
ncbi:MAG: Pr6Pr family membrane protein [Candidatus Eremiobacteraeota bacterium]|nr:Pr6Pr family membrane protein [Candidatus Eremiobacteraeota bacterium]